ncbi:MAG: porin family protein [Rhizobiales bacterium]|nr:porin family protein [Hyphomicrobiales bacterium]
MSIVALAIMDSRVQAQAAAASPNWAGYYVGLSIGGRWADNTWKTTNVSPTLASILSTDPNSSAALDNFAARFGGYLGYNWYVTPIWIAGIEADIGWANNGKSRTPIPGTVQSDITVPFAYINQPRGSVSENWDASIRGRIGALIMPDALLFATAGVAWQQIELAGRCFASGGATDWCTLPHNETHATTRLGWTIGGGVERMIGNWIMRAEYRYADFGTFSRTFFTFNPSVPFDDRLTANVTARTHTASFGIAYKLGGP